VKFVILHGKESRAFVSECEKIERNTEQTVEIDIPQEIVSLLQNLLWNGTLELAISVDGKSMIDLKDKDVKLNIVQTKSDRRKSVARRIGGLFTWIWK
jgi:hypothetical protein